MKKLLLAATLACVHLLPWANGEWVAGRVVGIDPARHRLTLEHAPIKSLRMEAMTMHFKVQDATMLAPLKVGDRVRFQVHAQDDVLVVQQIEVKR